MGAWMSTKEPRYHSAFRTAKSIIDILSGHRKMSGGKICTPWKRVNDIGGEEIGDPVPHRQREQHTGQREKAPDARRTGEGQLYIGLERHAPGPWSMKTGEEPEADYGRWKDGAFISSPVTQHLQSGLLDICCGIILYNKRKHSK